MAPFYGWGSTASRLQPLRGGSLILTTQFPEIPGAHFIDLGRIKDWLEIRLNAFHRSTISQKQFIIIIIIIVIM